MQLYSIARKNYFPIVYEFPDIGDFIYHAGSIWMEIFLTEDQHKDISEKFTNQVYLMEN